MALDGVSKMEEKYPNLSFNRSISRLRPAETFRYSRLATELRGQGVETISFGIGEPDFETPKHIVDAAIKALREGFTRYVAPQGILGFREEIARHVSEFTGAKDVRPEETMVVPGAKQAIFLALVSYIELGDEVIIPDPSYYSYEHLTRYAGGKPIFVSLREENNFRMLPEDLQAAVTDKTKIIILNSPHNPTGSVLTESDVQGILEIAKEKGILVVSDEVYDHFLYEDKFTSVLTDPEWRDSVIYINSLSKTYSMTGWRLGYIVAKEEAIDRFTLFAVNSFSCTTSFVQKAGQTALRGPQHFFHDILETYRARRDFLYQELNRIEGIRALNPAGAFYVFPNIKEILEARKLSTGEFALQLLEKTGVVMLPGSAFPLEAGEGYLRISYGLPIRDIKRGIEKFREFLKD